MHDAVTATGPLSESIEFLFSLEKFGMKMDLDNITALMEFAGRPDRKLKVIHVAGTNGKGSTCAMIASVLTSSGYKVGLYTSPHIERFTERIRIDGVEMSTEEVARLTEYFRPEVERCRATFFEATTAIMFKYFSDSNVDYAVVETGLGGRLDSTNIVDPLISVVTGIGYDHTEILGNTLEQIAAEKAGIIKSGRPAVVNAHDPSLKSVFREAASRRGAQVVFVDESASAIEIKEGIGSTVIDAEVSGSEYRQLEINLGGKHQVSNALTALLALRVLVSGGIAIKPDALRLGLTNIRVNTGHSGRLDILKQQPLVILDVAHNPAGVEALVGSLGPLRGKAGVLLFGAMRDKDSRSMLNILRKRFDVVILTQLRTDRSLTGAELNRLCGDIKLDAQVFGNSNEALQAALSQINDDKFLLIAGSHYLAGEVVPVFRKKNPES